MKLWILEAIDEMQTPWDCNQKVVVRAESAVRARQLAAEEARDETAEFWLDAAKSSCGELRADGAEGVVIVDCLEG